MDTEKPIMTPSPGNRLQRFVGDSVTFELSLPGRRQPGAGWRALLRTNLGRAELWRQEILRAHTRGVSPAGVAWRDIPMTPDRNGWSLDFPLTEPGYFRAKAHLVDAKGWQLWPDGPDLGISVHPSRYRTGNTIYCAFTRMFGPGKTKLQTADPGLEAQLKPLDDSGYTIIPPSGKLRDLTAELPHIVHTLGCRILHLLPVNPTPTTYARFGRFGSPYAALDLTAIDPALVVFDKRTTAIDQFKELTYAAHLHDARVFLDIVINHTGWGSRWHEDHPDWFLRGPDQAFVSPGAWGTVWEDLVELKHLNVELWDTIAEALLVWCHRGVDGFRCDAGYMIPVAAWQYIIARVQQEYPETIFLLEGLGGAWETTEALLTEGGMQWAYSELFQNYSGAQLSSYLDHCLRQNGRSGLLVHYSETHDNHRLAERGRAWSLLRNRLCGLVSTSGGFGFTGGVEWLATEKIRVHGSSGMAWNNRENIIPELARLNQLLAQHPCFFDGASIERISPEGSGVCCLRRQSAEGNDIVLVVVNTDPTHQQQLRLDRRAVSGIGEWVDLLGQPAPQVQTDHSGYLTIALGPAGAYCLAPQAEPKGLSGEAYRRARAQAAWALQALTWAQPAEHAGVRDWRDLAAQVDRSPFDFLATLSPRPKPGAQAGTVNATYPAVIRWSATDARKVTLVPPGHWLLVEDARRFRASLHFQDGRLPLREESLPWREGEAVCFRPQPAPGDARLDLELYSENQSHVSGGIRYLGASPSGCAPKPAETDLMLLTNGRGGMARMRVDLGRVLSKYDCVLGANLHPSLPVDRHILAKRLRAWINADGFISPLDFHCMQSFCPDPCATWNFVANAGDARTVEVTLSAEMLPDQNTVVFHFSRPSAGRATGKQLPAKADVRLTLRLDIEDRNFHTETKHNGGAELHFKSHTSVLSPGANAEPNGFLFAPAQDRQLRVYTDAGTYHPQPEWSFNLAHPVEQSRGQEGSGDAFSPGWFEVPLAKGARAMLVVTAEPKLPAISSPGPAHDPGQPPADPFLEQLVQAARAFVVRRGAGKTVVAGYPWFLDWGRDTFICARGLLAGGLHDEVRAMLQTFARFEDRGTLPNTIYGEDASNRDTSDAPLWFGLVCEELGQPMQALPAGQRNVLEVLRSIATHYVRGTPNGIRMDPASGLVWSPSHFTWMDTNYPAGTPREGYPVEIQALWIRLLRHLAAIDPTSEREQWGHLAELALASVERLYWSEDRGYYADVLSAKTGQPAAAATADTALRSNCLFLVSLGLSQGARAQRCVEAALRHLVVPGALRTLAPLPVTVPLPIRAGDGRLLNDPQAPYWGRYEGDEDTRRKPAYHNGTAWTWTFPNFCEALARAWNQDVEVVAAAQAYLGSMEALLNSGCLGQLPEIVDGDAPHRQRGCDAQAWAATEALRVWKWLRALST